MKLNVSETPLPSLEMTSNSHSKYLRAVSELTQSCFLALGIPLFRSDIGRATVGLVLPATKVARSSVTGNKAY